MFFVIVLKKLKKKKLQHSLNVEGVADRSDLKNLFRKKKKKENNSNKEQKPLNEKQN